LRRGRGIERELSGVNDECGCYSMVVLIIVWIESVQVIDIVL
jgi:hypothetical protein